jgi:hypothetical protein
VKHLSFFGALVSVISRCRKPWEMHLAQVSRLRMFCFSLIWLSFRRVFYLLANRNVRFVANILCYCYRILELNVIFKNVCYYRWLLLLVISTDFLSHNQCTIWEQIYYTWSAFDPRLGSSSGQDTRMWRYTATENHEVGYPPSYIKNQYYMNKMQYPFIVRVYEMCKEIVEAKY